MHSSNGWYYFQQIRHGIYTKSNQMLSPNGWYQITISHSWVISVASR